MADTKSVLPQVGDSRSCRHCGHAYLVTPLMFRRRAYPCPACATVKEKDKVRRVRERMVDSGDVIRPLGDIFERAVPVPETGCWLWTRGWRTDGYGYHGTKQRRRVGAHRAVYLELVGPIPPGMFVCHRCDTPPCVNPDHLFLGTHAENQRDRAIKGRARGAGNGRALLDERDALAILASTSETKIELAERFGISPTAVYQIQSGQRWSHLSVQKDRP